MDKTETVVGAFLKMRMEAFVSKRVHRENTKLSDALFDKDAGRNHRPLMVGLRWKEHYFINEDEASYSQVARALRQKSKTLHTTSYKKLRIMRNYIKTIEHAVYAYNKDESTWGMSERLREALECMNAAFEHFGLPDRHVISKSLDNMLVNLYNELCLNYKYTDVFIMRPIQTIDEVLDNLGIRDYKVSNGDVFVQSSDAALLKISNPDMRHLILEKKPT